MRNNYENIEYAPGGIKDYNPFSRSIIISNGLDIAQRAALTSG